MASPSEWLRKAGTTGNFALQVSAGALPDGNYSITTVATDAAGNQSAASTAQNIVVDASAPASPVISSASLTNDATPVISGLAEAGSEVSVTLGTGDNTSTWTVIATNGSWEVDTADTATSSTGSGHAPAAGANPVSVTATDAAGNVSSATPQTLTIDFAPTFAPADASISEASTGAGALVYTPAAATDDSAVTYSLKAVDDHAVFEIDAATGKVYASSTLDYEVQTSYDFTIVATDAAGNATEGAVTLTLTDVDEIAPEFTSIESVSIDENVAADTTIYTAAASDASGSVTYSLKSGFGDASALSIASDGKVTLASSAQPNYEAKSSYNFMVVATDAAGNATEKEVTVAVNNLDDTAPTITSGTSGLSVAENVTGVVVYTASANDFADVTGGVTYSLASGDDAANFSINAGTGEVTLNTAFDSDAGGARITLLYLHSGGDGCGW